jgi:ATP-binding cassette subfamily B protein
MLQRYACVRQADTSDCGAASLAIIARHYDRSLGLEQLRELVGTDRSGVDLLGLVRAAERLGFSARGVHGSYDALVNGVAFPAIAHVKNSDGLGHFVVVHRAGRRGVVVADPQHGIVRQSREEFCRTWTGHLLLVVPDPQATPPRQAAPPTALWRFLGLFRGQLGVLAEVCFCALLLTLLGVATAYFIQHLVDSVLVRQETGLLNALGAGMVLVVAFRTLFGGLRQYLLAHVSRRIDLTLVANYARHLLGLPLSYFEKRQVGDIVARAWDGFKVSNAIANTTTAALVDGLLVVGLTGLLWLYDARLALVATAFVPLVVLVVMAHHPAVRRYSRRAVEAGGLYHAHLAETCAGAETLKAHAAEGERCEEGENRLVQLASARYGFHMVWLSSDVLALAMIALAGVVVLWYGGHRVMTGALSVGQLMFFYALLVYLLEPLQRLASANFWLQDALIAVERLGNVLDLAREPLDDPRRVAFAGIRSAVEVQGVTFTYGYRGNVLQDVNLRIPAGQTVAIIGESGSGKSTLLKLLQGLCVPTAGRVAIDGVNLRDIDLTSLRQRIGVVSQDAQVFTATLRDNVALGRPEATLEEVVAAVRAAGLEDFVAELPERYDTVIGERGANLSGGQRQRLAIARALLRKPDLLIFDEATSHLDTATEQMVRANLRGMLQGCTVVLVAHRLGTVKDADRIYVLQHGQITEEGTHRQLLEQEGWYADLWRRQTEGASDRAVPYHRNGKGTPEGVAHG